MTTQETTGENLKKYSDILAGGGGGEINRHVLPAGRYKCKFAYHDIINIKRGTKFCDPARGESPDDMLPRMLFTFDPIDPSVLANVPEGFTVEIGFLLSPSFGTKAKLPPFLLSLSKDGVVPYFGRGEGAKLHSWLNSHLDHIYSVTSKPSTAGDRNYGVQIAYVGPPEAERAPAKGVAKGASTNGAPRARAAAKHAQDLNDAFPDAVPVDSDNDEPPF